MPTPRRRPAVCALLSSLVLVMSGCGTSTGADDPPAGGSQPGGNTAAGDNRTAQHDTPHFGSVFRFDSGLVVTVSRPTSFQPSESAYPPAEHAVAFYMTIRNETGHRYRLSAMSVTASTDGREAALLTDPTQGYTGITDSGDGLSSDAEAQVGVAFAVPERAQRLKLTVKPDRTAPTGVTYTGRINQSGVPAR